jgi:hypothetical protein
MSNIVKTPLQLAIDALEHIANPIGHFQARAKAEGSVLSHMALQIASDPNYLKGVASDALALLRQPAPRKHSR